MEDITPDTTPHIILIKRVSSVKMNKKKKGLLVRGTSFREQSAELSEKGNHVRELTTEMNHKAYENKETQIFLGSKSVLKHIKLK